VPRENEIPDSAASRRLERRGEFSDKISDSSLLPPTLPDSHPDELSITILNIDTFFCRQSFRWRNFKTHGKPSTNMGVLYYRWDISSTFMSRQRWHSSITMPNMTLLRDIELSAASACYTNAHYLFKVELPSVTGHGSINIRKETAEQVVRTYYSDIIGQLGRWPRGDF
jgi:hypothetical protein